MQYLYKDNQEVFGSYPFVNHLIYQGEESTIYCDADGLGYISNASGTRTFDKRNEYFTLINAGSTQYVSISPANTSINIQYSHDGTTWITPEKESYYGFKIPFGEDGSVKLKGTNLRLATSTSYYTLFRSYGGVIALGNIASLLYGDNFRTAVTDSTVCPSFAFYSFFTGAYLLNASLLCLPFKKLGEYSYAAMFKYGDYVNSPLTSAPTIEATEMSANSCKDMFYKCASLSQAPELKAEVLGNSCYMNMFAYCGSLKETPVLPAKTTALNCYKQMFYSCSSLLKVNPILAEDVKTEAMRSMFVYCNKLVDADILLKALSVGDSGYYGMFEECTSLKTAPQILATQVGVSGFREMFKKCSSLYEYKYPLKPEVLTTRCYQSMFEEAYLNVPPEILATSMSGNYCCYKMFRNCQGLDRPANIQVETLTLYCYADMYAYTPIRRINQVLDYATTLAPYCYSCMFLGCTNLRSFNGISISVDYFPAHSCEGMFESTLNGSGAIVLHGERADDYAFNSMFHEANHYNLSLDFDVWVLLEGSCANMFANSTLKEVSLFNVEEVGNSSCASMFLDCRVLSEFRDALSAPEAKILCYAQMFKNCEQLETAPLLLADALYDGCYEEMFRGCSRLNRITALTTDSLDDYAAYNWVYGVSPTGIFTQHYAATHTRGNDGIPVAWEVQLNIENPVFSNLAIELINPIIGNDTVAKIAYSIHVTGVDPMSGDTVDQTIEGEGLSNEFEQNLSDQPIQITVTFSIFGLTASITAQQGPYVPKSISVDLRGEWQLSTLGNPDPTNLLGVYESFAHRGVHNSRDTMIITFSGYPTFTLYAKNISETCCDYVMTSYLDDIEFDNDTYAENPASGYGSDLDSYGVITYENDGGEHLIAVTYKKDSSVSNGDDCGYVLILK